MKKDINKEIGLVSKSGICIDGDIFLRCEHYHDGKSFLPLRMLLAFFATFFTLLMAQSFVADGVSLNTVFYHSLVASVSVSLFRSKYSIVRFCSGIMTFIYLSTVMINMENVKYGFYIAANRYLKLSEISSGTIGTYTAGIDIFDYKYMFYFFAALALFISLGTSLACVYRIDFPILFIFTFPIFELGMYQGLETYTVAVVGIMVCWVTVLAMHIINHTTNKAGRKNTFAVHERSKTFFFTSDHAKSEFYPVFIRYVSIVTAAAFIVIIIFSAVTGFTRPQSFERTRTNLHQAISRLDVTNLDEFFTDLSGGANLYGVNTVGGTNGGILGTTKGISFNGVTALTMTAPKFDQTMYLRGYVAGRYENNTWTAYEEDPDSDDFNVPLSKEGYFVQDYDFLLAYDAMEAGDLADSSYEEMDIKVRSACAKFVYAPYSAFYSGSEGLLSLPKEIEPFNDSYVLITKAQKNYSVNYIGFKGSDWSSRINTLKWATNGFDSSIWSAMNSYDRYVYDRYTDYPGIPSLKQAYDDIVENYLDGSASGWSYYDHYNAIKNYFSDNFKYDLTPGETPKGEDYIDYFLTEQKRGYCTYFATTGVELLRMFGYPARYVEGYMILESQQNGQEQSDGRYKVTVPDKCAHAWAEVFIDNVGWMPAEFTPGYDGDNPNLTDKEKGLEKEEKVTTTTTATVSAPVSTSPTMSKSTAPKESTTKASTVSGSSDNKKTTTTAVSGGKEGDGKTTVKVGAPVKPKKIKLSPMAKSVLLTLAGVLTAILAVVLNRRHKLKMMNDRCTQKDLNKRVMEIFKYSLKYLDILDISADKNLTDLQLCSELLGKCHEKHINELDDKLPKLTGIAVKAHMSGGTVSEEEADFSAETLEFISMETVKPTMNGLTAFTAKYLRCLY